MNEDKGKKEEKRKSDRELIPWKKFLEEFPINTVQNVSEYWHVTSDRYKNGVRDAPLLRLWCWNENCNGTRNFAGYWQHYTDVHDNEVHHDFLVYTCKDCEESTKRYAVVSQPTDDLGNGIAVKVGEYPDPHIDIPSGLPSLLGEDYEAFVKGLKCEKQGFGIGAFAYYRRVVEKQKGRFITKILEVAQRLQVTPDKLRVLKEAAQENQFSRAVDMIKDLIPESLLVNGHNPLKLVHRALSIGIHEEEDAKCLELAHSIRMVLCDLAERIRQALREQAELKSAVSALLQFQKETKQPNANSNE